MTGATTCQPFRYTGRRYDAETGLYYYRARYYSSELGRFLQTDPVGYEDQMNMYAYVGNDPINNTDPTGKIIDTIVDVVLIANDIVNIAEEGFTTENTVSLLGNVAGLLTPGATGVGAAAKALVKGADKISDTNKATKAAKSGGCCFVAGTQVLTKDGLKNIEDIKVGDLVWSRNPETGEQELKPVTDFIPRHERVIWELTVQNAAGATETFETTDEHPWWVDGQGWKRTDELSFGMRVEDEEQNVLVVTSVRETDRKDGTYNLTVADFHTYFVGNLNVLVHNCGDKVNLASPQRTKHILDGDATGGGHLSGTGKPGKSEFPASMSRDDIMHEASDIATMPNPSGGRQAQGNRTVTRHTNSDGVDVKVVDDGKDIITAHPENQPRNP